MTIEFDHPMSIDDHRFGSITVQVVLRQSLILFGDDVPHGMIERQADSDVDDLVPIGTRDPDDLTMMIAGVPASLSPARGRLSRRSFRVDVEHEATHYRLQPNSMTGSRLTRDGIRIGEFFLSDGDVIAEWEPQDDIRATDAAVGYALAAAFGTGAASMWMAALDVVAAVTPG